MFSTRTSPSKWVTEPAFEAGRSAASPMAQSRLRSSMTQILMQGDSIGAPHSVIDRVQIGWQPW